MIEKKALREKDLKISEQIGHCENSRLGSEKYKDRVTHVEDDIRLTAESRYIDADTTGNIDENDDCYASYFEKTIDFKGDANFFASQIIEFCNFENYFLYEKKEELSLALGIHALLLVNSEYTTLKINNKILNFKNEILSDTINKTFSSILIKNYRAYGIANYGLARYNYNLPLLFEEKELLKLFIPEIEVRFIHNSMVLRALEDKKLEDLEKSIRNILHINNEDFENSLKRRVDAQKLEVPEIYSYEPETYIKIVADAIKEIKKHKYQKVVLSRKIPLKHEIDMVASYIAGRKVNSPERSYLFKLDGLNAAGFSPETVVEVDCYGWISTLPLAGTRSTGSSEEEKDKLKDELLNDTKEILEHVGTVKFTYEEVKKICEPETVSLSDFMSVVNRGTVQHIASRVKGKLKAGLNSWYAFNALFPAVTSSGVPKKESIDTIGKFETSPRNLFGGCVITFESDGVMDSALVLRTIFQKDNNAWLYVGAGIGEMSNPSRELQETYEKISSVSMQLVPRNSKNDYNVSLS